MRIDRLELTAFGPFTGRVLDFSVLSPGLHVVYGPNEAGKSSSLRALQALLFGFPHSTADNFLHAYGQLLVGGILRLDDGRSLAFRRRKKARNDLFDDMDQPLSAEVLAPYVQGLHADLFSSLYGINHDILVRGGQGILDQHGAVGQTLFAAGSGLASLKGILDGLEAEAGALYRPRASTAAINQGLTRHGDLGRALRQACLSGRDWEGHRLALDQAEAEFAALRVRQSATLQEIRRLERLQRALPQLGRQRLLREGLAAVGEVPLLPADFSGRRRSWEEEDRKLQARMDTLLARRDAVRVRHDAARGGGLLLEHAGMIDHLHQRLGEYRKGQADRPVREGQRIEAKSEAGRLLRRIRPDLPLEQAASLDVLLTKEKTVRALGLQREAVLATVQQRELQVREQERALGLAREELARSGDAVDPAALLEALAHARRYGDLDAALEGLQAEGARLEQECAGDLGRLGLWQGGLDEMDTLQVPLPATVDRFEQDLAALDAELRVAGADVARQESEMDALRRQLREIEYGGVVPSEKDLKASREHRDRGWALVRSCYVDDEPRGGDESFAPDGNLPAAYEQAVLMADATADRMYREADRVRRQATLLAALETAEAAHASGREACRTLNASRDAVWTEWKRQWPGLTPLPPREMRAWLAQLEALRSRVRELHRLRTQWRESAARRQELRQQLLDCLPREEIAAGATLHPVLTRVQLAVERAQTANERRERHAARVADLEVAVDNAGAALAAAQLQLQEWHAAWAEMLHFVDMPAGMLPVELEDAMDVAAQCRQHLRTASEMRVRRDGIDRDAKAFEDDVRELAERVAPSSGVGTMPETAEQTVLRLKGLLTQAERNQAVLDQLAQELVDLERELSEISACRVVCDELGRSLFLLARCETREAMLLTEERYLRWRELRGQLDTVENDLAVLADGRTLAELELEAATVDPDVLPAEVASLRAEIEDTIEPELRRLGEAIGREKSDLARMDGSDKAAILREEMETQAAGLIRMSGRYLRLKLAEGLLRREIERYRERHQDPLLTRASEYFQRLTLGSFVGLRGDLDDKGQPVLIGLRGNGSWVYVDGMSSGTRDQLYLALRLATLELRAASAEAMPFVVDDILINFDEERSRATLDVLAGLGRRMQIILFTHQQVVADMARAMDSGVVVHILR